MTAENDTLRVHVNVEVTGEALQTIVQTAKQMAGRNEKGHYRVDTADKVGEMISKFLREKDFTAYVRDRSHYA